MKEKEYIKITEHPDDGISFRAKMDLSGLDKNALIKLAGLLELYKSRVIEHIR